MTEPRAAQRSTGSTGTGEQGAGDITQEMRGVGPTAMGRGHVPPAGRSVGPLERVLRLRRDAGRKLVVPYVTAGVVDGWLDVVRAVVAAGADAVEVGLPFSDPIMDGPTIQQASLVALQRGMTPAMGVAELARADVGVPIVVMTYYNLVFRSGERRFARTLAASGVAGAIVPDLPLEESEGWRAEAGAAGVDDVLLVAPSTPDDRIRRICEACRGFVYGVGVMGVTGERAQLADSARQVARRVRAVTDLPVCVGVGITTPEQAADVCQDADGVVVGSALVRRLLDGGGPDAAAELVAGIREALD